MAWSFVWLRHLHDIGPGHARLLTPLWSTDRYCDYGPTASGGPDIVMTQFAQTLSAMTPDLTVAAASDAAATRIAVTMQALSADPTEPPAHALATAHAEFEVADRLQGIQLATDILQNMHPSDPEPYESYILAAAEMAAESPIPFPFSGTVDLPDPAEDLDAYQDAVYTDAFIAACDLDSAIPYEVCARDAFVDFPTFTRALSAVNSGDAVPVARSALQSPNKLVFDAAVFVLCWHEDLQSIPVFALRVADFDWPVTDIALASNLLACDDDDADALAFEVLGESEGLFDSLDRETERFYGR